jgi:hypothetical protein
MPCNGAVIVRAPDHSRRTAAELRRKPLKSKKLRDVHDAVPI